MAIEKKTKIESIEVVGDYKYVQVKTSEWVEENERMIGSKQIYRTSIAPGECPDTADLVVKNICNSVHTPDVVSAYKEFLGLLEE